MNIYPVSNFALYLIKYQDVIWARGTIEACIEDIIKNKLYNHSYPMINLLIDQLNSCLREEK